MTSIAFIIVSALINRLRGWNPSDGVAAPASWKVWAGRITTTPIMALWFGVACFVISQSYIVAGIAAVGWFLGAAPALGDYFDFSKAANNEITWIDRATQWLPNGASRDTAAMSLRGAYYWPLFIGLSAYYGQILWLGVFTLLMGVIYWFWNYRLAPFGFNHGCAELTMGGLIGALIIAG